MKAHPLFEKKKASLSAGSVEKASLFGSYSALYISVCNIYKYTYHEPDRHILLVMTFERFGGS